MKFTWNLTHNQNKISKWPVYLHLNFENFHPMIMQKDEENLEELYLYRMCPPDSKIELQKQFFLFLYILIYFFISYFFTNPMEPLAITASD